MTQNFAPHEQRVLEEQQQLQEKIDKLRAFINSYKGKFSELPSEDKKNLVDQEYHMSEYHRVLLRRIQRFTANQTD